MDFCIPRTIRAALAALGLISSQALPVSASEFSQPWLKSSRAIVIDAYEYTEIDWESLRRHEHLAGFINKASDGLPPAYACSGDETEQRLCKALWKRYAVSRELYVTRRAMARSMGLLWGAYHLARPGNPIDQANHFLDFTQPTDDDFLAIDVEGLGPEWMSLEDTEEFARHIHRRIGRFPVLYTNGVTAKHIAANAGKYPLLSRLPLWYARYTTEIEDDFPNGHWQNYALWQFSSNVNCGPRACPYRVHGTGHDIDVNISALDEDGLRAAWPFKSLVVQGTVPEGEVPVPVAREDGLSGNFTLAMATVVLAEDSASQTAAPEEAMLAYAEPALYPDRNAFNSLLAKPQGAEIDAYTTASVRQTREGAMIAVRPFQQRLLASRYRAGKNRPENPER